LADPPSVSAALHRRLLKRIGGDSRRSERLDLGASIGVNSAVSVPLAIQLKLNGQLALDSRPIPLLDRLGCSPQPSLPKEVIAYCIEAGDRQRNRND
jgi:hypothetical protein